MRFVFVAFLLTLLSLSAFGQCYDTVSVARQVLERLQEIVNNDRSPVAPLSEAITRMKATLKTSPDKFLSPKIADVIERLDTVLRWEKIDAGYRAKDGVIYRSLSDFYFFKRSQIEPLLSQLVSLLPKHPETERRLAPPIDPIEFHAKGLIWAIYYGLPSTAGHHLSELLKAIMERQNQIHSPSKSQTSSGVKEPKR